MIASSLEIGRNPSSDGITETVHILMDVPEVSCLLSKTTKFLRTHLNLGSFEGPTGASRPVVMRLSLACDLLLIALNVKSKDGNRSALKDLESAVSHSK